MTLVIALTALLILVAAFLPLEVMWLPALMALGLVGHAVAAVVGPSGFTILDGAVRTQHAGQPRWHARPGDVPMAACTWWRVRKL